MDTYGDGNTYRGMETRDGGVRLISLEEMYEELNAYCAKIETELAAAREEIKGWYVKHNIGWCGKHAYQNLSTDEGGEPVVCPQCCAEAAEKEVARLQPIVAAAHNVCYRPPDMSPVMAMDRLRAAVNAKEDTP